MSRSSDVAVRAARPEDAAAIHRVHERSIRTLGPAAYGAEEIASWAKGLRPDGYAEIMRQGRETLVVAEAEGRILGFGSLKAEEVNAVYVAPEAVRRGVGSALLRHLEDLARAEGRRSLRLTSTLIGEAFYKARGYRARDRRKHPTRGGVLLDGIVMEKDLGA